MIPLANSAILRRMAKSSHRPRRTKAETQQEFVQIRGEVGAARDVRNAKLDEATRLNEAEVREAVEGLSVETATRDISTLGVQISKTLADLSGRLTAELHQLAQVREAVALERAELQRLHKVDVALTALDALVQEHDGKRELLESERSAQRAAWDAETETRERAESEREEMLKKQRQRETEEYEYKKAIDRKKAQEKYDEELRALDKKTRERQEALEKSWQAREAALKAREEEDARLREEAAAVPARLQSETERARHEGVQQTEQRLEQQMLLLTKEREADRRLSDLQITTLEAGVARQAGELAALQKQLDEAKQQVQDIALKAIEGASGARALAHVNQIAMEQAKLRGGQA